MTRASDTAKLLGAGATILDGTTISTADNTTQLSLTSTDADSSVGPVLDLFRNSATPGNFDVMGKVLFSGEDSGGNKTEYAHLQAYPQVVTDGSESGYFEIHTLVGGTDRVRIEANATEVVINNPSIDSDFRVESDNATHALFVEGSSGNIGIGDSDPTRMLHIKALGTGVAEEATIMFENEVGTTGSIGQGDTNSNAMIFTENGSERMRIASDGTVMVGRTSTGYSNTGAQFTASGAQNIFVADGDYALGLGRRNSNGTILEFRRDNSAIGRIAGTIGLVIGTADTGLGFETSSADAIIPQNPTTVAGRDDAIDLGNGSNRFDDIFATNTSITTSDRNEKQDIEELTDAEKRVAVVAKGLMRKYRWKSKVAEKGDKARTHFGIIAQDLQDAFTAESLDASKYAMFCSDTWWEKEITVDAIEAVKEVKDEEGNVTTEAVEAKEAYTYMDNKYEATDGYTEKTRLGVRYSELLAFIISAI